MIDEGKINLGRNLKMVETIRVEEFKDLFAYSWEQTVTANTTGAPIVTNILADSDFVAVKGIASMYANVAARTHVEFQDVTVIINDTGSGRNLEDKAIAIRHLFGHPRDPVIYQPPKLFIANSSISLVFANNANADVIIRASMVGYKLFRRRS